MFKKHFIVCFVVMAIVIAGAVYFTSTEQGSKEQASSSICEVKEIIFYYLDGCEWCNKVKAEGTLEKIEGLGVKINKINAAVGTVRYKFQGVPTFVIKGKVYEGYKTFEEIKGLLGCQANQDEKAESQSSTSLSVVQKEGGQLPIEINVKAFRFGYEPNVINAKKGERIKININNTDILHGIRIPDLGLSGNEVLEFTADQVGEFTWYCANMCGQGHGSMQGKLTIE